MSSEAAYFPEALANATDESVAIPSGADIAAIPEKTSANEHVQVAGSAPEVSDEQLMEQVRQGSREALASLFRRHNRPVRNVAYRILRDESEADDLVQEVFLYVFEKAKLFDPKKGAASSWIIQIAYHRAINRRQYLTVRQHYNAHELEEQRLEPSERRLFVDEVMARTLLNRLRGQISDEQRQTLEFHHFDGYTFREIAEKTGQTLGNVRNHYYRGLERLRACIFPQKGD